MEEIYNVLRELNEDIINDLQLQSLYKSKSNYLNERITVQYMLARVGKHASLLSNENDDEIISKLNEQIEYRRNQIIKNYIELYPQLTIKKDENNNTRAIQQITMD